MNQQAMMRLKKMQKQMMEAQEKLESTVFQGTAGGGMVTVEVKGTHEVVSVKIDPDADILDMDGAVVGRHRGAAGLTIGQRRGVGVSSGGRIYVCAKSMADNTVTVGPEEALYSAGCAAEDWNWIAQPGPEPFPALVKTRYRQTEQPVTVSSEEDRVVLRFQSPQRAVTTGQAAVIYDPAGHVLGGGTITQVIR